MTQKKKDYFVGIDAGTGSVGMAVTDPDYQLIKIHGQPFWSTRLFESAETAEERRIARCERRRLDREKWRIQILQEIFSEEIYKVDPGFFQRLKESRYYPEDKIDANGNCPELPDAIFADKDYTDKDYHKAYPTIYHLRKYLMKTDDTPDIRLIYLALHHMMTHRGHFLLSGDINRVTSFKNTFLQLEELAKENLDWNLELTESELQFIEDTLKDRTLTKSAKKSQLLKTLCVKTKSEKAVLSLITGSKVKLSAIFDDAELDNCEKSVLSFANGSCDESYMSEIEIELGERYDVIEAAKAVFDWSVLVDILGNCLSISEAKIQTYEKHKADLEYLKKVTRKYLTKKEYNLVFVESKEKLYNYVAYVGVAKQNNKKVNLHESNCTMEEFYKFLEKNVLKKLPEKESSYLKEQMEQESFLPKQKSRANATIPYQVHLYELKKIIEHLKDRIPLIKENQDRIIQLFEFRIPYYVGPLGRNGNFSWAVRKSNDKIYPWNFTEVIDAEASAERFIRRMTNKCTYLFSEDVLPKDSLLYSKYMVLNELNNLRLNDKKITVELKQQLYRDLFCKYRKVTQKRLKRYLTRNGIAGEDVEIAGIDGDFKAQLNAYHDFNEKLPDVSFSQNQKEEIILNIVLFGEDKNLLRSRLSKKYPDLTDEQLKIICTLSYKGWGRLSKQLLEGMTAPRNDSTESWNLITALWETNENLMQLLSTRYCFGKCIEEANAISTNPSFSYDVIESLPMSPAVKRQVWQIMKMMKEVVNVMKYPPKRIFIEMAREHQESIRTKSRKTKLMELYKNCNEKELMDEIENLDDNQLRSDRRYLYFLQKGRCLYSGEVLNSNKLFNDLEYNIDHIYPQCKVDDDSIDNRNLVKTIENEKKGDKLIDPMIIKKMSPFWKELLDQGFISRKKYERMIRTTELTPDELAGFISRQLVETRQSTKVVAEVLKQMFPDTEIVYVKAKNISKFRQEFNLIKVREMNDFHHAKDAYLSIVVGNTYHVQYTKDPATYIRNHPKRSLNPRLLFKGKWDIARNGETAWKAGENGTIVTVKNTMRKNNVLVVRQPHEAKGELFKENPLKKGKGQIRIKGSDKRLTIEKYGGYNKAKGACFMLVKSKDKKGNEMRTLEVVPLHKKNQFEKNKQLMLKYLQEECNLVEPEILIPKIGIDTLFEVDGFRMWLSGRTGNRLIFKNANQLVVSAGNEITLKKVEKYIQRKRKFPNARLSPYDGVESAALEKLYDTFLEKLETSVYQLRLSKQAQTLREKKERFMQLTNEEKCMALYEILHIFQCRSCSANLQLIGGTSSAGILTMDKNITKCNEIYIINQSATGIYHSKENLNSF